MKPNHLALFSILASGAYAQVNPCIICPNGVTAAGGENHAPYANSGDFTTCAEFIDAYKFVDAGSADCGLSDLVEQLCCYNEPENPCIICPNGITAAGGENYTPGGDTGGLTCVELVRFAQYFESGSYMCGASEIDELSCCPTELEDPCLICPNGATAGNDFIPNDEEGGLLSCSDLIEIASYFETGSSFCGVQGEIHESLCCSTATPTVVDNTCIICPGGATEGDDYTPYTDADGEFPIMISGMKGNPSTCAELIDTAKQYEPGSEGCAASEIHELYCCPSVPEDPCIICPNGVTHPEGDDHVPNAPTDITDGSQMTCGELIYGAALLETESDYCRVYGEIDESDCCPPEVTPAPTPMPEDDTTAATTTTSSTSVIEVDTTTAPADDTTVATTTTTSTSAPEVDDPCIICPNGITAGDDFVPNASSGNSMTCLELINSSMDFESGSQMCSFSSIYKISCCPTTTAPTSADTVNVAAPTNTPTETPTFAPTELPTFDAMTPAPIPAPVTLDNGTGVGNTCIICPDGTDAAAFAPYADDGDSRTCADLIDEARLYEIGSDECGNSELHELHCCYTAPENPCIICPDGATAGDDYVPEYAGNSVGRATCKEFIDGAKRFESESDACGLYDIDVAYCCPSEVIPALTSTTTDATTVATTTTSSTWAPEVENPCIICPNGATAGRDDFQPFAGAGETKTCMELLDDMTNVAVEAGSDLCESLSEIEALCCGDVDSAPSPVEPKPPTDPSSGGSVSGLVGFTFISIVSTLCVIACL